MLIRWLIALLPVSYQIIQSILPLSFSPSFTTSNTHKDNNPKKEDTKNNDRYIIRIEL